MANICVQVCPIRCAEAGAAEVPGYTRMPGRL